MDILIKRLLQFLTLLGFAIMLVNCGPSDVLVPLNKIEIPEYDVVL